MTSSEVPIHTLQRPKTLTPPTAVASLGHKQTAEDINKLSADSESYSECDG
jgi:hypothetical protein